ncbi:MAG: PHP domain-containing protein [Anaerolineales bacterium]|nr:PHP domain-containing protein [Anaerolineales bacterium]
MKFAPSKHVAFEQSFSQIVNPDAGWYRGDFHTHTQASDGIYPADVLAGIAKAEGLDFIAITDHNTFAGLLDFTPRADFLVIPGLELTFDKGHFNTFALEGWRDWMEAICSDQLEVSLPDRYQTITELMQAISADGLLNSINHPFLPPWDWQFEDCDLRQVGCLEIWNDLYWPDNITANPEAVTMWTNWLNAGYRITAIGGSDYHFPPRPEENKYGERLGMPMTCVYADELSAGGILDGIRQRRAYVTKGPQLTFEAEAGGEIYQIGADMGIQSGEISFTVSLSHATRPLTAQLVENGLVITQKSTNSASDTLHFQHPANPTRPMWYRLDITDETGDIWAITNPIFSGPAKTSDCYRYGDFTR